MENRLFRLLRLLYGPALTNDRSLFHSTPVEQSEKAKGRMDRAHVFVGSAREADQESREELAHMSVSERLETITYLRECFYGAEATTGRLQRLYTVVKRA